MTTMLRLDRRRFLVQSALAGAAVLVPRRHGWAVGPSDPEVDTVSGTIRGTCVDRIYAFKGIPYGASTAGANRFMPPQKPAPWGGVREAVNWAGHAPQAFAGRRRPEVAALSGTPDKVPVGEDCPTVNLWTPGLDTAKRPVMVWFHGGGFPTGFGQYAAHRGRQFGPPR
jgi:para-nitrobenzyl esterase